MFWKYAPNLQEDTYAEVRFQSSFNKITLRHGCSLVNLLHILRIPFSKNTSEWLLLSVFDKSIGWRSSTLFKWFQSRYFSMYNANFLRTPFFYTLGYIMQIQAFSESWQLEIFIYIEAYSEPMAYSSIFKTVDIFSQLQTHFT